LVSHTRKGRRGGYTKREVSLERRRKKDLRNLKCFSHYEFGHYASQRPQLRRRGRKQHTSAIEVDDVTNKLHRELLLVSSLSSIVSSYMTWLVDSGASCHMIGRELFESLIDTDSRMCVDLGMGNRHAVQGSETMCFQLELGDVLRVTNVKWVPKFRRSVLSV